MAVVDPVAYHEFCTRRRAKILAGEPSRRSYQGKSLVQGFYQPSMTSPIWLGGSPSRASRQRRSPGRVASSTRGALGRGGRRVIQPPDY